MKRIYLAFLFFLLSMPGSSQIFQGQVTDEMGIPLNGANVYFDGSSMGRITDLDGNFSIEIPNISNPTLIISYLGFYKIKINDFSKNNQVFALQPNIDMLNEVIVKTSTKNRERLLRVFRTYFLGSNKYGKNCRILNEDVINIWFDESKRTVYATAKEPLLIENKLLNYKIRFDLERFDASFINKSFSKQSYLGSSFLGTSFFEDIVPQTEMHTQERLNAFKGTLRHFFWSLLKNPKHEYSVYLNETLISPNRFFELDSHPNKELFLIKFLDSRFSNVRKINYWGEEQIYESYTLEIRYKTTLKSIVEFRSKEIQIDVSGNYLPVGSIALYGDIAQYKLGNMLPLNFQFVN